MTRGLCGVMVEHSLVIQNDKCQILSKQMRKGTNICRSASTPCLKKNVNDVAHYNFNAH